MFTGIITHLGKFKKAENNTLTFSAPDSILKKMNKGMSISVNGVCLTLIKPPEKNIFSVKVIPETLKRTMLYNLRSNEVVNLELPMTPDNFFAGHLVQGHVDGTGVIKGIKQDGKSTILKIKVSPKLSKYIVEKGSVALNGISLTVIDSSQKYFSVGIIPHTLTNTMLKNIKIGKEVNIETDIIAKYLEKIIKKNN